MSTTPLARLADTVPVLILAVIAGAGSFTHIRQTATEHGQTGWMAWAVAICIDLTCVMAARERQRDRRNSRERHGWISWPTVVLVGGITLSLAANLAQAAPTAWGWITAATPAGTFLTAVSMIERRAFENVTAPVRPAVPEPEQNDEPDPDAPSQNDRENDENERSAPDALLDYARRFADEHLTRHGKPITRDALRSRLGVSSQLASELLRTLRDTTTPKGEPS
ncbi:DUF2637 domain-containing protein [Nonomuraea sp. NPDC050310]|uniref:DUF2637 domain-containing protein n=1 Tax=unclassified Nonomuraea TaxID=2593643 RepID=UPI00340650AE